MPYDVGMANRLRAAGLQVKEVAGWQRRGNRAGSNFFPRGLVVHHTAGAPPRLGTAPSLRVCIQGHGSLPGPLCNIYMDYNGVIYTVAAGAANHAGRPDGGSWQGMTGNSKAWGFEIEHPGTYPLEADRTEIAARAVAAIIKGTADENMVPYHKEWASSRKIDLATWPSPDEFRGKVADYLKGREIDVSVGYPAWFWDWSNWYLTTDRVPEHRPDSAPDTIPSWAWDGLAEIEAVGKRYGMTGGERDWISWYEGGKEGERPNVPQTIPDRWWDDQEFVHNWDDTT